MTDRPVIRFTVRMIPTAKGRPRAFALKGRAIMYTPAKTAQAEQDFIALADPHAPAIPFEGPVELVLRFILPIPASWSIKKRQAARFHTSKPDLDNFVKTVADALSRSGRWWRDDSQIAALNASKQYGPAPQIDIEIHALTDERTTAVRPVAQTQAALL